MAFSNLKYDTGAYQTTIKQSTGPIHYRLDPIQNNQCQPCRPAEPGYLGKVGVSLPKFMSLINVDSEIRGLNYPTTKDPSEQFNPNQPNPNIEETDAQNGGMNKPWNEQETYNLPECNLTTEHSRLSLPVCLNREIGINRFDPLCLHHQDENRWLHPGEIGINYRMVVKDNHRPCVPKPLDPRAGLPMGGNLATCVAPSTEWCQSSYKNIHKC